MKCCCSERLCSCLSIPLAIKSLSLITISVWILSLLDVMMEGSGLQIRLTAVGALTCFVINTYTFLTATDNFNILVRYK